MWLAPNVGPDENSVLDVLQNVLPKKNIEHAVSIIHQMNQYHPSEPHWYLSLIGVRTEHRGKGIGSILLKHILDTCDQTNTPAHLEATNQRNVKFYEKHGFELIGKIQAGTSPTLFAMLRSPHEL